MTQPGRSKAAAGGRWVLFVDVPMLRLPTIRARFAETADKAERDQFSYRGFLAELFMAECEDRDHRRAERAAARGRVPALPGTDGTRRKGRRGDRVERVVVRLDQDLYRPPALRCHRRQAHLQRHHHRNRHPVLPAGPHQKPARTLANCLQRLPGPW